MDVGAGHHTPSGEVVDAAVARACRAPSLHNTQPWRWIVGAGSVRLGADPDRVLHATDRSGRQMILSCGIALGHFRVAIGAQGWATDVEYLPNPHKPDLLAVVTFRCGRPDAEIRSRATAIERRVTNRAPLDEPFGLPTLLAALGEECGALGVSLTQVSSDQRERIVAAADLARDQRRYDTRYAEELRWWVGNPGQHNEGVPAAAVGAAVEQHRVDVSRRFSVQDRVPRGESTDRSALLVLATDSDGRFDVVRAGEAASTVLLAATAAGLQTAVLTHVTELDESRDLVRAATGGSAIPQLLVRVGRARDGGRPAPATPRRPMGEVVERRR